MSTASKTSAPARPVSPSKKVTRKKSTPALPDPREVGWWEYVRAWDVAQKGWPESSRASIADLVALKSLILNFMDNAQELSDRIAFVCSLDSCAKDGLRAAQALGDIADCDESAPLGALYSYLRKRIEGMEEALSMQDAFQGEVAP